MSFSCRMEFLRHCGEPNQFWWRSLYVALECILLCRRGMCGIGKGWPGIPKTIKLLKQMLLWGVEGEKVLIQFPLTSQCCHVRTSQENSGDSTFPLSNGTDRCKTPWHWNEQSLSGSTRSNLGEFLHHPGQGALWRHHANAMDKMNQKWCTTTGTVWLGKKSVAGRWWFSLTNGMFFSWSCWMREEHTPISPWNKSYACVRSVRRGGCLVSQFPLWLSISINAS